MGGENMGHFILVVLATILAYSAYVGNEEKRAKRFFETHALSNETRTAMKKEAFHDNVIYGVRLLIWLACITSDLLGGEVLGIVFSVVFTIEALIHIYAEAYGADRTRITSLTMITIPFGTFVAVVGMKHAGIIGGILLGILAIALTQGCALVGRLLREEERK